MAAIVDGGATVPEREAETEAVVEAGRGLAIVSISLQRDDKCWQRVGSVVERMSWANPCRLRKR